MGISGAFTNWVMNELQLLNLAGQPTLKLGQTSILEAQTSCILRQKPRPLLSIKEKERLMSDQTFHGCQNNMFEMAAAAAAEAVVAAAAQTFV